MMQNMRMGVPALFKSGTKHLTGVEATVLRNIEAIQALSDLVRTSLGPNGMSKIVINHIDKLFLTSDAATIVRETEVTHAAARMIIMAAEMQEVEHGDGSNFVMVLSGALLKKAGELIEMGLSPVAVVEGYEHAFAAAQRIGETLAVKEFARAELYEEASLAAGIRSAIAAKQFGQEDLISRLVARACVAVMPDNPYNFLVDNIRVAKLLGGSLAQSEVIRGMVFPFEAKGTVKNVKSAKIAVFTCSWDSATTETKGQVLISNAEELVNYNASEESSIEAVVKGVADSGVNVVVTGQSVGEMALHFANKYGIMVVKLSSQWEVRRLCRATKANPLTRLQPVDQRDQGYCDAVVTKEVGELKVTVFSQEAKDATSVVTILLRASTHNILNDVERACDDGINIVRAMGRDARFCAGAGAFDIELARQLVAEAGTRSSMDQYAFKAFGEAFEAVPRVLAENAGLNALETLSQLYAAHERGETSAGVEVEKGGVVDATSIGVIDSLPGKLMAIKLAVNAVITILRTDSVIQSKPAGGPKAPANGQHWDEDQ